MKDIKGYEKYYAVTRDGEVWSKHNKIFLSKSLSSGYEIVSLCANGNQKSITVHRLVAMAFLKNPDNKNQVNHKDCNKSNNNVDNLEWCTSKENINHAKHHGLMAKTEKQRKDVSRWTLGEKNINAKLNYGKVFIIKKLLQRKNMNQNEIADFFNVNSRTISTINRGNNWTHVII